MDNQDETAESIALSTIEQLRYSLEQEKQKTDSLTRSVANLENHNDHLSQALQHNSLTLQLETARSDLALACLANDSPSVVIHATYCWLNRVNSQDVKIYCGVRVQESWMLISQHDGVDYDSVECEYFDKLVSQTVPGEPFAAEHLCSDRVLAALRCSSHENIALLSTVSQRCVWIFCSSLSGRSRNQDSDQSYNNAQSFPGTSLLGQRDSFDASLPSKCLAIELANLAATSWGSLFDTASSICIALLLRQFEQQEQQATVIAGGINSEMTSLLLAASTKRTGECALWRQAIPAILQKVVTLNISDNDASIFASAAENNVELFLASRTSNYITTSRRGLVVANMGGGELASGGDSLTMTSVQQNCIVECCSANNPARNNSYDVVYGDYNPACIVVAPLWAFANSAASSSSDGRNDQFACGIIIRLYNSTISRLQRLVLTKTLQSVGKLMKWWLYSFNNAALTQIIDPLYVPRSLQIKAGSDRQGYDVLNDGQFTTSNALGTTTELVRNSDPSEQASDSELLSPFLSLLMDVYGSGRDVYSVDEEQSQQLLRYIALLFNSSWCLVIGTGGPNVNSDVRVRVMEGFVGAEIGADSAVCDAYLINNCGVKRPFSLSETKQTLQSNVQYWLNCIKAEAKPCVVVDSADATTQRTDCISAVDTVRVLNHTSMASSGLMQLLQPIAQTSQANGDVRVGSAASTSTDSVSCSLLGFVLSSKNSSLTQVSKSSADRRSDSIVVLVGRSFMPYEKKELTSTVIPAVHRLCTLYTQLCNMKANHIVHQQSLLIATKLSALESGTVVKSKALERFRQDLMSLYENMAGPHTGKSGYSVVKTAANVSTLTSASMNHQRFRRKILHVMFKFAQKLLSASPLAESSENSAPASISMSASVSASASGRIASNWIFRVYLRDSYSGTIFELLPSGEYTPVHSFYTAEASRVSSRTGSRNGSRHGSRASSPGHAHGHGSAGVRRSVSPSKRVGFLRASSPTSLQDSRRSKDMSRQSQSHQTSHRHRYGSPTQQGFVDSPITPASVGLSGPGQQSSANRFSPDSGSGMSSSDGSDSDTGMDGSTGRINRFVDEVVEVNPLEESGATNLELYNFSYMGYESQYFLQYMPRQGQGVDSDSTVEEFDKSPNVQAANHACAQADLTALQSMCQAVAEVVDMNPSYFVLQHDSNALVSRSGSFTAAGANASSRNSADTAVVKPTYLSPLSCLNLSVGSLINQFSVSAQDRGDPSAVFADCVVPLIDSISSVFNDSVVMFPILHLEREGLTPASRGERSHMHPLLTSATALSLEQDMPSVPSKLKDYLKSVSDQHSCDNEFLIVSDVLASLVANYVLEVHPQVDSGVKSELLLNSKCLLYTVPLTSPSTVQPTFGEETCSSTFIHILVLVPISSMVTAIHLHYMHQLLHCFFTPMKMMQTMHEVSSVLASCTRFSSRVHEQLQDVYRTKSGQDAVDVVSANSTISSKSVLSMQYLNHCITTVALESLQQVKQILHADNAVAYTYIPSALDSVGTSSAPVLHELVHFSTHMKLEISLPNTISSRDDVLRHSYPVGGGAGNSTSGTGSMSSDEPAFKQWVTVDTDVRIEELLSLAPNTTEAKALYTSESHQIVRVLMQGVAMSSRTPIFNEDGVDEGDGEGNEGSPLGSDILSPSDKVSTFVGPVIVVFAFLPVHKESTVISRSVFHNSSINSSSNSSSSSKPKSAATRFAMEQLRVIATTSCGLLRSLTHSALVQSAAETTYKQYIYRSISTNIQGAEWSTRTLSNIVSICRAGGVPHPDNYVPEETPPPGNWPALIRNVEQWNNSTSADGNISMLSQMAHLGSEAEFIASNMLKLLMELEDQLSVYKLQYETLTDKYKDLSKKSSAKDHTVGGMIARLMGHYCRENTTGGSMTGGGGSAVSASASASSTGGIPPSEMEKKCVMLTNQVECDYQLLHRLLNLLSQYHPVEQVIHEIQAVGNIMMQNAVNAYLPAGDALDASLRQQDFVVVGLNYLNAHTSSGDSPSFPLVGVRSLDLLNSVLSSGKPVFIDASGENSSLSNDPSGHSSDVSISYLPVNLMQPSDPSKIVATLGVVQYVIPKKLEHSYFISTAQQCIHCTITHCLSRYKHNQQGYLHIVPVSRPLSDSVHQPKKLGSGLGAFDVMDELCSHLFFSDRKHLSAGTDAGGSEGHHLDQIYFDEKTLKLMSKMIASVLHVDASLMVSTYLPHSSLPSIPTKGAHAGQSYKWSTQGYVARWLQTTDSLLQSSTPSAVETLQVDDYCTAMAEEVADTVLAHSHNNAAANATEFLAIPFVMKSILTKDFTAAVAANGSGAHGTSHGNVRDSNSNDFRSSLSVDEEREEGGDNESLTQKPKRDAKVSTIGHGHDHDTINKEKYIMAVPLELGDNFIASGAKSASAHYQSAFLSSRAVVSSENPSTCAFLMIESSRRLTEVDIFGVKSVLMVIKTLCTNLEQRATIAENAVQMTTAEHQLTSLEHMMHRLMHIIEKQKLFGLFLTDLYSVGSTSSSIQDISNHSEHSFAKNWALVEDLFETKLKDLLHVHSIHGVVPSPPTPSVSSPTRPSTGAGNINYNSGGVMLASISSSSNQSPQQIALLCLTANTPIYCKDGDLASRLPCVYIPVYLAEGSRLATHDGNHGRDHHQGDPGYAFESCYVLVVTFESVKQMQEFHYEDGGDDDNAAIHADSCDDDSDRALGLDHMLVMEVARNVSIWCNYQSNITALEHNYQNSVDLTRITERLLVGLDEVNQHLPSSANASTATAGVTESSIGAAAAAGAKDSVTISSIDALSSSMDFIFSRPIDRDCILGGVRLHWLDRPTNHWLSSSPNLESEDPSHASLQKVLDHGQWTTDANSAPIDSVISAVNDYKHDLAHHNATTHLSKSRHSSSHSAARDTLNGWKDCKNMFVTDIVGNIVTNQEFIDAGSKIWVVCNPVYKSVDKEALHSIDEDDDDEEAIPPSVARGRSVKVDMLNITECLLEISIHTPIRYCSVIDGCLHTSLNNILLGIQSHCTSVISTVLQYQYTTAYIAAQSRFMDMQKQCLDIFNDCTLELSKEGGRIISLCTSMQQKLSSLAGVVATGVICTNTTDGSVLFDALNNFRPKTDKGKTSSSSLEETEDRYQAQDSAASANKNLFLSDINLNSNYKQLLLNYDYAEVQFQCYDVMGKMFVFSQTPEQENQQQGHSRPGSPRMTVAQATPYMPNEDILYRRKTNITHLKLNDAVEKVIQTLCKALGRRVYELLKGHKNKQLMLVKQEEVGSQRDKLMQKDDTIIGLETTKALLLQDIKHSTEDLAICQEKLRAEQLNSSEANKQHKALSSQLRKVVADCKAEAERKERILKKNLFDLDAEKSSLSGRYDKIVRDYEKLQKKFEDTEKGKKDLEMSLVTFKQQSKAAKEEMDTLVNNLQADHGQLMRQVEHAHVKEEETKESNERRFKAVVNKLQQLEDEHGQCKSIIFSLRKQTDSDVKALGAMKTRHLDAQTEAQSLKAQVAQLRTEKNALEAKCANFMVTVNDLTARVNGSAGRGNAKLTRAATMSNPSRREMESEWTEIMDTAASSAPAASPAVKFRSSGSVQR